MLSPSRRRRQPPPAPEQLARSVSWPAFYAAFAEEFEQGQHVTILGPTRSGKTQLGLEVIELRDYVLFLATKPSDPLIAGLERRGYQITRTLDFPTDEAGLPRRVVYWPVPEPGGRRELKRDRARQSEAVRAALDYAYRAGGWCVFCDETIWLADDLGLRDEITALLYQGRTLNVSMICAAQRPAWIPRACYSQADHIFLFRTSDRDDLRRLGDISGTNVEAVRAVVATLGPHEFLYVGTRPPEGQPEGVLLRSRVEGVREPPIRTLRAAN